MPAPPAPAFPGGNGQIAFSRLRVDGFEIFKMKADGTRSTRLTTNESSDIQPAWSADGKRIVFASDRDGTLQVFKRKADGTGQKRVTDDSDQDFAPVWSPDGTEIAFVSATATSRSTR